MIKYMEPWTGKEMSYAEWIIECENFSQKGRSEKLASLIPIAITVDGDLVEIKE